MMWAVPCFVMTTGALLLEETKEISYKKIFGKYVARILTALIVFCLIFRFFDMFMDKEPVNIEVLKNGIYEILTGTSWSHMWYLYLLIGLYFLLPFYKKIAKYSDKQELRYLLGVYMIFLSLLPLSGIWGISSGFYIHVSTIYPFYLFCGYAVHKKIIEVNKWIAGIAAVLSTIGIFLLTIVRWRYNIEEMEQLWSYSSILVILQAVGIFMSMDRIKNIGSKAGRMLLDKIDRCSFGIYLIHMIFVRAILRYAEFDPYEGNAVLNFIGLTVIIFIVSYAVTWILKKFPLFRKIL